MTTSQNIPTLRESVDELGERLACSAPPLRPCATSPRTSGAESPVLARRAHGDLERDLMLASRELADVHDRAVLELSSLRDTPSAP
jgi:hypothetical protein